MMEIGYTNQWSRRRDINDPDLFHIPYELPDNVRLQHIHVIGKTGVGKSTLLENMFLQDPCGVFIDPHGQSALHIINHLDPSTDTIYFDASDTDYPLAFNPLENVPADLHPLVTEDLMTAFRHYWADSWGILLEEFMRYGIRAMLCVPDGTILGIKFLLTNEEYRKRVIKHIKDPIVKQYWEHDFEHNFSNKERNDRIQSTLTRLNQLIADPLLRNIIGQPKNKIDFSKIFDKAFIINLNEGKVGDTNARLLGSLLLSKISTACRRKTTKKIYTIIVDEVHMFGGSLFSYMLSTIRKYGVSLVLAHQHLAQLSKEFQASLVEITGTLIAFRVGILDAKLLDIPIDQGKYRIMLRSPTKTIELITYPNRYKPHNKAKSFIAYSRNTYCSPKLKVEKKLDKFYASLLTN